MTFYIAGNRRTVELLTIILGEQGHSIKNFLEIDIVTLLKSMEEENWVPNIESIRDIATSAANAADVVIYINPSGAEEIDLVCNKNYLKSTIRFETISRLLRYIKET